MLLSLILRSSLLLRRLQLLRPGSDHLLVLDHVADALAERRCLRPLLRLLAVLELIADVLDLGGGNAAASACPGLLGLVEDELTRQQIDRTMHILPKQ